MNEILVLIVELILKGQSEKGCDWKGLNVQTCMALEAKKNFFNHLNFCIKKTQAAATQYYPVNIVKMIALGTKAG